jgi:hypothetical protein
MKTRLLATLVVVGAAAATQVPASAATPKGFTINYSFTDATPDPSGNAHNAEADHCSGTLPQEKPVAVKIPGPGYVEVALTATGDWSMQLKDSKGLVLTGDDVNPPQNEVLTYRFRKAQTVLVLPCNMTGLPNAKFRVTYTYKK